MESIAPYRPTLSQEWIERIETVFGRPIRFSNDCEALRQDLIDRNNIYIGDTTVKRMFGFAKDAGKIRRSTYDQLAVYIGFKDLDDFEKNVNASTKQIEMAELYNEGVEAFHRGDFAKAAECWSAGAEDDYPDAIVWLGFCYMNGKGVKLDYKRGLELYTKVADMGYTDVQFKLAREYFFGDHINVDYDKAFKWLDKCCRQPDNAHLKRDFFSYDGTAEYLLGKCYEHGHGTDPDLRQALNYYHAAYDKGDEYGLSAIRHNMHKVGSLYDDYNQETKEKWFAKVSQTDAYDMPMIDRFYLDFLRKAPEKYISVEFDPQRLSGNFNCSEFCSYERWEYAGSRLPCVIMDLIVDNTYESPTKQHIQIFNEIFADGNMNLKTLEKFVNEMKSEKWEKWFKDNYVSLKINPKLTPASRRMDAVITHLSRDLSIVGNIPPEASLALMRFHGVRI